MNEKEIYGLLWQRLGYLANVLSPEATTNLDWIFTQISRDIEKAFIIQQIPLQMAKDALKERTGA